MKKIKTNFPNQTDTGQNQKPEGHEDNKPTGFLCVASHTTWKRK